MGLFGFGKKKPANVEWPFSDAPNTAVFTNKHVMAGKLITAVYHDEEEGAWQFHTDDPDTNSNAVLMIVALSEVFSKDASIAELASLPVGHVARRSAKSAPWVINKHIREGDD